MTPTRFDGEQWMDVEYDADREFARRAAKYTEDAARLLRTTLIIVVANLLLTGAVIGVVLAVAS